VLTISLTKDRETKGTWRYAEDDPAAQGEGHPGYPVLSTLYVQRAAVAQMGNPERIVVTVDVG